MNKHEFYEKVNIILGIETEVLDSPKKRRRWGPRTPGNGRYEGRGICFWFCSDHVSIMFHTPEITYTGGYEGALKILEENFK